ncbi:MAG: 50S ribosomal protein L18 [Deltaproteobacteria bacterium]|nr:50S ribosomal protein L18 [Deltaproteobacteria bacterium]
MSMFTDQRRQARKLRQARVRKSLRGTAVRPRLSVFRSEKHIYAQVISDETGETLLTASTLAPEVRGRVQKTTDVAAAKVVGEVIGKSCIDKGITAAVFDRNGFLYHGRVRAVAEGAREAGLKI